MTSQKFCKNNDRRGTSRTGGVILVDILLAFSLAAVSALFIAESSIQARRSFERAKQRQELLDLYEAGVSSDRTGAYGNDRVETVYEVATGTPRSTLEFRAVRSRPLAELSDAAGEPLCSADFVGDHAAVAPVVRAIHLPIDPFLPLTDLEVRNGVAYISADSPNAGDPDMLIADVRNGREPGILSSINTGPGIAAIALAGTRIYAAVLSTVSQLQILRLQRLDDITLESAYRLPLPYATATPTVGSAIRYDLGRVYLGTEKWDGEEFNVIDVSDPSAPAKMAGYEIASKVNDIAISGDLAYVAGSDEEQLRLIDVRDPSRPTLENSFSPSGWQRQEGKIVTRFEGQTMFGRTSGGFNIRDDHEAFAFATTSEPALEDPISADIGGGVYGIVMDRSRAYLATREVDQELVVYDRDLATSSIVSYPLPVAPQALVCDNDRLYVLARAAPFIYEISFN
ncbi:MAG: hypothetical protein QOG91_691 [Candidatus Parcubacteria bacterium]|jgi:hypothetical protein|nr:hypothetical protein [Candidatus Parcubacteria bacterium]